MVGTPLTYPSAAAREPVPPALLSSAAAARWGCCVSLRRAKGGPPSQPRPDQARSIAARTASNRSDDDARDPL
ncbi:MAG: hypothetical protein QOG76_7589 [Pseudonocardiales bacterium]|nr:hypothetical protein [Pseudonocardiales bacterium]